MKKLRFLFLTVIDLFKVKVLGKKIPLAVSWCITKRCNYRCMYCGTWKIPSQELSTSEICNIIDEMKKSGVRKITFTGGEPLLRDDIGEIVDYVHKKDILVNINSNGSLFKIKIHKLRNLDSLGLSLEGPEEVHDVLRQKGSFKDVMEAVDIAVANKIKISFSVTLNSLNFNCIDYLLNLAKRHKTRIVFQPSTEKLLGGEEINPVSLTAVKYSQTVNRIIQYKAGEYRRIIRNSLAGLKHLSSWPNLKGINCPGGFITCRINSDGSVFHCAKAKDRVEFPLNCIEDGFRKAFNNLSPITCSMCSCALRVEASYILRLNLAALMNAFLVEMSLWGKEK